MITVGIFRGDRITVGLAERTSETDSLQGFSNIQHLESGERLAREEFSAEIPVEAALEAARQRIIDEELRREL